MRNRRWLSPRGLRVALRVAAKLVCSVLGLVVAAPILLVILPLTAAVLLYVHVYHIRAERRLCRQMRARGRLLARGECLDYLARGEGTILLESPTIGWNVSRAWWTRDDGLALAPDPPATEAEEQALVDAVPPFTRWCHETYTHPETGSASLVRARHGYRLVKQMRRRWPDVRVVEVWSGKVDLVDAMARKPKCEGLAEL